MDTPQPEFSVVPTPPRIQAPAPAPTPEPTPPIRRVVPPALLDELRARFPDRTFLIPEDLSEQERDELQFQEGGYLRGKMLRAPYIDLEDGGFYDANLRKIRATPRIKALTRIRSATDEPADNRPRNTFGRTPPAAILRPYRGGAK